MKSKSDEAGPSTSKEGSAPPSDSKKAHVAESDDAEKEKPTEPRSEVATNGEKTNSSAADAVKDLAKEEPMEAN